MTRALYHFTTTDYVLAIKTQGLLPSIEETLAPSDHVVWLTEQPDVTLNDEAAAVTGQASEDQGGRRHAAVRRQERAHALANLSPLSLRTYEQNHQQKEIEMSNEQKKRKAEDNIVPLSVGDPANSASLKIDQSHLDEYFADKEAVSSVVGCERPPKGVFFTVLPEPNLPSQNRGLYWVLQLEGRDPYLVTPDIAEQKKGDEDVLRPVFLVRYVTMAGDEALGPLKINPPDGKANKWNSTARKIMEIAAAGKWVRIVSMGNYYRHQVSRKTMEDTPPQFSDRTFHELIDIAFEGRVIDTLDHEVWMVLSDGERR